MSTAINLKSNTHIVPVDGRMTVACDVENFIASGLSIEGLLDRLRGALVAAARAAVYVDPDAKEFATTARVGIDMDVSDPWLFFTILNPARFLSDLDAQCDRLRNIVARFLVTNRPPLTAGGRHA